MRNPTNHFKRAIAARERQIGMWCTLGSAFPLELLAGAGYDWLLIDTEHSPNEVTDLLPQLQAVAAYSTNAVVRPAWNDPVLIKRILDLGAQSLLIPFVQNASEAERAVRSTRYAPAGIRGVSGITRATRFGRISGYSDVCSDDLCVLIQVETLEALADVEAIASVPGVDGVFVGPADLAASMGLVGQANHPRVIEKVLDAIRRIVATGKPAGVLTSDEEFAKKCIAAGSTFTAVGVDAGLLARESTALARRFAAPLRSIINS